MDAIFVIFPNQLFEDLTYLENIKSVYLVEEFLFFGQYSFHKQKIAFHRASMKFYADYLAEKSKEVHYVEASQAESDARKLMPWLVEKGIEKVSTYNPVDFYLKKRITENVSSLEVSFIENPLFLNSEEELKSFFKPDKKKFFQTSFYKSERQKRNILMDGKNPAGGKWTFDAENRKKYPKNGNPPQLMFPESNAYYQEAVEYVKTYFSNNYGDLGEQQLYPLTYEESKNWLNQFLERRFNGFGTYEDALFYGEKYLHHSILTPMLNTGLISPGFVLEESLSYAKENNVPINDVEGFVRQIIGWREFIRGVYGAVGVKERTRNYWGFNRKIPSSFYEGTTGIKPVDDCIKSLLKTGYNHHIERLMILGNFMLLCEFDPDEVYKWFMEMYIDSYDWVMVPNVYGMSQFADGGMMSTKPYISGSNYLMKMSNYLKGDWQEIWDGLFWRFMHVHRDFFISNPRLGMLVRTFDKMGEEKRNMHLMNAEEFLEGLD